MLIASFALVCFAACDIKPVGKFYKLEEVYEAGQITQEDLQSIADYYNSDKLPAEKLDAKIEKNICQTAAYNENHNIYNTENKKQYTAKDFSVSNFYGVYNGYYVVKVKRQDIDEIYSRREKEIFGVKFYLPSAFAVDKTWIDFIIWKEI